MLVLKLLTTQRNFKEKQKKKLLLKFYTSGQNKNFRALIMDRYFKIVSIIEFKK